MRKQNIRICIAVLTLAPIFAQPALADDAQADIDAGFVAFQRGDIVAAMGHYTMAADAGSAEGQARLAWILDQSEQNEEAVKWYRQYGLGEMYAKGEGVEKDESLAVEYFVLAADNGHAQSQRVLINAYEKGLLGLTVDLEKAAVLRHRLDEQQQAASEDVN
jgi:TPR repeat protein